VGTDLCERKSPRVQLATAGREVWQGVKRASHLHHASVGDPVATKHLQKLKQVEAFRKHGVTWTEIQILVGIGRATYYRRR